jgi:hypothetical protein
MTISVYDRTKSKYGDEVYNMKEANATRGGGNDIRVVQEGYYGFSFGIENKDFCVYITHKTAERLLREIVRTRSTELFTLLLVEDNMDRLTYKPRWERLGEKETTR